MRAGSARRRGWWRGVALLAAGAALVLAPCERSDPTPSGGVDGEGPEADQRVTARVLEVVDGDTIVAELPDRGREHVRYIGVDTPESNPDRPLECFGHEAEEANARLVGGREVILEVGVEPRDDYGRLLAFVRLPLATGGADTGGQDEGPGPLVNTILVRRGFARALTIAPNDALAPLFEGLEAAAARAGRGLWGACNT